MKLEQRTALVTGANRGIGRAITQALLESGVSRVYAAARDAERLPDFGDARAVPVTLDITNASQVADAAGYADDVDLLFNNAGVAAFRSLTDGDDESLRRDMEVNYFGTLSMIRHFLPVLEAKETAAIVNVASIVAFANFPSVGGYSASKAALFSASQGLRIELAPRGISVHTVNPGPIDTDMARDVEMDKTSPEETARNILAALEAGEADIFPDVSSRQMFGVWQGGYRDLEKIVYEMHHTD